MSLIRRHTTAGGGDGLGPRTATIAAIPEVGENLMNSEEIFNPATASAATLWWKGVKTLANSVSQFFRAANGAISSSAVKFQSPSFGANYS